MSAITAEELIEALRAEPDADGWKASLIKRFLGKSAQSLLMHYNDRIITHWSILEEPLTHIVLAEARFRYTGICATHRYEQYMSDTEGDATALERRIRGVRHRIASYNHIIRAEHGNDLVTRKDLVAAGASEALLAAYDAKQAQNAPFTLSDLLRAQPSLVMHRFDVVPELDEPPFPGA